MDNIVTIALFMICIITSMKQADGIQCYKCEYTSFESDSPIVHAVHANRYTSNDERCLLHGGDFKKDPSELVDCDVEGDGKEWVCAKSDNHIEVEFMGLFQADFQITTRGCENRQGTVECSNDLMERPQARFGKHVVDSSGVACTCDTDGCNGGKNLRATELGLFIAVLCSSLMM